MSAIGSEADITESIRYNTSLARKNETGRRTVREQSTVGVRDAAFRRANTTATVEDFALGSDRTSIQRVGADKRNLELDVVLPMPLSSIDWMARPIQLSRRVAERPPCTVPHGLR